MSAWKWWKIDGVLVKGRTAYEAWLNSKVEKHFSAVSIEPVEDYWKEK